MRRASTNASMDTQEIALTDMNDDWLLDIVSPDGGTNQLSAWLGNGEGSS